MATTAMVAIGLHYMVFRMESEFLEARYANLFRVGHNAHEIMLDFGQVDPDSTAESVHTRIITAAPHGRVLLELLAATVADYEANFGPIATHESTS